MFVKPAVRGSLGNGACEIGKKKEKNAHIAACVIMF